VGSDDVLEVGGLVVLGEELATSSPRLETPTLAKMVLT
jgi:hypothetical protein